MTASDDPSLHPARIGKRLSGAGRSLSLKAIIAVAFGLLLAVSIAAIVVFNERTLSRQAQAHARQKLQAVASQMRYRLDRSMFERYRDIHIASSLDALSSGAAGASRRVLDRLQETYTDYAWIGFINTEGTVVASTGGILEGANVSGRDWFQHAQEGPYVGDVHAAVLLAGLLPDQGDHELRLVDIAAPVHDSDGKLIGVLGAHLNWSWAEEVATSILATHDPEERIAVSILSSDGTLLLSSDHGGPGNPALDAGASGSQDLGPGPADWSAGGQFLTGQSRSEGYRAYPGLGWQVVVRQPTEVALAHVADLRHELTTVGGALTIGFMGLGWLLAGWIGKPLRAIAHSAAESRRGRGELAIPPSRRFAEVRSLSKSLRILLTDLQRKQEDLRRTAEENERRQRFLSAILSNMDDAVFVAKGDHIVFANDACASLFGVTDAAALYGGVTREFLHEADSEPVTGQPPALQQPEARIHTIEKSIVRQDGSVRITEMTAVPFVDDTGPAILMILRDVTSRKDTERQLQRAQRLEAVGQLTGGMAHDFNNLLTVIIGNLDLLEVKPGLDENDRELAGMALEAALHGADLTRQLLAFSRRQSLEAKPFDLNELVATAERLLRRTLGERVQVRLALSEEIWPALADPVQVESALANLAINARDAMPEGGALTIETGNRYLDEEYAAANSEVAPGEYVMLAVSDTGTGMSPEVLAKAYEPFFTTKIEGKGSGLGLAMVYGFAKQSGGHVKIYSEIGYGTTVRLYLPRADRSGKERVEAPNYLAPGSKSATVLVVDDNDAVRSVAVRQIAELGYHVIEAEDAAEALEIISREPGVDLLFTDVVMPGALTGPELARRARDLRPDLKVLFTSGFADASIENGAATAHMKRRDLLSKPYRRHELAQRLAEVIQNADGVS